MQIDQSEGIAPAIWFILRNLAGALALVALMVGLWFAMQARHERLRPEKVYSATKASLELPAGYQTVSLREEPTGGIGGARWSGGGSRNVLALFISLSAEQQADVLRRCRGVLQRMLPSDTEMVTLCRALDASD